MEETINVSNIHKQEILETMVSYSGYNNQTNWEYKDFGARFYSPSDFVVWFLYAIYGAICLLDLIGNLLVFWIVLGSKQMRTVTNLIICNLAFADIVMAIFIIPFQFQAALYQRWIVPYILCNICPFVQTWSVTVSALSLCAIAIHRYRGIMSPLKIPISKNTALWLLLALFIVSVVIALPTWFMYMIKEYHYSDGSLMAYCDNIKLPEKIKMNYQRFLVIVQYIIPFGIISTAYALMGRELWKQETPGNRESSRDAAILENKRKTTKMMVVVVVVFGVCWFPFQMYNFLSTFLPDINKFQYINIIWFGIHWLAMSSSCCNPFIYGIYNKKFRNEFSRRISMLKCPCKKI